ncbi:MAG: DUF115 domain-containing protein [Lachnospiraceae bacterium]|nr:DUF115 domain-containing protein [Lachnospiraceae bacterium]
MQGLVSKLRSISAQIFRQDYTGAKLEIKNLTAECLNNEKWVEQLAEMYGERFREELRCLLMLFELGDMIYLADHLLQVVVPALERLEREQILTDTGRYCIEKSLSGVPTLRDEESGIRIHSSVDPMDEARQLVEQIYDPEREEYVVWGCGLLYHVAMLWEISEHSIRIRIYEEDETLIQLADEYGAIKLIPDTISLIHDPFGEEFTRDISSGKHGILMHYPSIKKIKDSVLKNALLRFSMSWSGTVQLHKQFRINFRKNVKNCEDYVDSLKGSFQGREVVIVGGGPSVDSRFGFIRESVDRKRLIISVGTILRRLMTEGVIPDYAVIMDSSEHIYKQISEVEGTERVPLIVDSVANWKCAENYNGKKYLALQRGYDQAEKLSEQDGRILFDTGGSVTTLAMDIALRLGAGTVYLVGVDLAYKNGFSHATGTLAINRDEEKEDMLSVLSVTGETVYTTIQLDTQRRWIEKELARYKNTPVYNCSDCGAFIEGTKRNEEQIR